MLVVISPAKKLDWQAAPHKGLTPRLADEARALAAVARGLSANDLRRLMHLSPALAELNVERFHAFAEDPEAEVTRPAVFGFAGDTYVGLHARSLEPEAFDWARDHLRILSGLYGLLRPEDAIQPHRLEMGTRLVTARGRSLYDWWGPRIAEMLRADALAAGAEAVVNCASREYFSAVDLQALGLPVITPQFLDARDGEQAKVISFHAKRARGAMARFMMEGRLVVPADLRAFDWMGYRYQPDQSSPTAPVFLREHPASV